MCAAPGSKTFQLLEALHASGHDEIPTGFVVANDVDAQRCNLLTHQTKRMCSPCLMITNHDAQTFPKVLPLQPGTPAAAVAEAAGLAAAVAGAGKEKEALLYDRILCDVPCSGDGTMRKAPDIWRRWGVHNGNGLHNMQLRIALQGIRLLKVRGGLVTKHTSVLRGLGCWLWDLR
jgi:16S rRNA C967 or C1407 C5-methylase (RsmB/RsmF family)